MYINYLIIFIVLSLLSVVYIKLADKFNIIDKPNHRSSHTTPTIRGGGILFLFAIIIYFIASGFQYPYFVLGVSLIAIISFIDDIITLSSNLRLPFQFLAIALCLFELGFELNDLLVMIPLLIFGVGFINIYNFMDGINGITGMYSIVLLLGMYFINVQENVVDDNLIIYAIASLMVFGFYNFRKKARMFAGDIGSITIAVLLFFLGTFFMMEIKAPILMLFVLIYGADAVLTIGYRKFIGEKISEPHRKHIYQKLVRETKLSHLQVAGFYAVAQAIICVVVYFGYTQPVENQLLVMLLCIIVFVLIYVYLFKMIEKKRVLLV